MDSILKKVRTSSIEDVIDDTEEKIVLKIRRKKDSGTLESKDLTVDNLIRKCIVGQQRTGRGKQFVFLCGDYVYKGPFSDEKYENIKYRSAMLKKWNAKFVLFPVEYKINKQWEKWIIYDNLAKNRKITTIEHQESFSDYRYKIVSDGNIPKLLYYMKKNKEVFYRNYDITGLILSYVYLFILGTGDMNLSNTLIDDKESEIYIIDYDENRKGYDDKEELNETFYLSKPPAKDLDWVENVISVYSKVSKQLLKIRESLKPDIPQLLRRLDDAVYALNKYYDRWNGKRSESEGESETESEGESKRESTFGKMVAKHRNTKTYSGFDFGVMKSALQKYIRRGMTEKALMVATEMYRILEVKERDGTAAQSAFTNFINRLRVIAVEDIGVADMSLAVSVVDYFNVNYESGTSIPPLDTVLYIVKVMCESKKTRLSSHAKNIYTSQKCFEYAKEKWNFVKDEIVQGEMKKFVDKNINDPLLSREEKDLREIALAFYYRLKNKDYNAIAWIDYYIKDLQDKEKVDNMKGKKIEVMTMYDLSQSRTTYYQGNRSIKKNAKNPMVILWNFMDKLYDKQALNILRTFYFNNIAKADTFAFMMIAVVAIIEGVDYQHIDFEGKKLNREQVKKLKNGDYRLKIDEDYVYDKHTKGGGTNKDTGYFRQVSSHVENEDMKFRNEIFFDTYYNCY